MWLKETWSSSLILSFECELASQLVITRVRLLTLREPSIFTSNIETHFIRGGTKLWNSLVSPRQLNTELSVCVGDELDGFFPIAILIKTEDLGWLSLFSRWNTDNLEALSFPILWNIEGRYYDINGCNLSNTDALELDTAWSPPSLSASSIVMYCTSNCSYLHRPKFSPVGMVHSQVQFLVLQPCHPVFVSSSGCH